MCSQLGAEGGQLVLQLTHLGSLVAVSVLHPLDDPRGESRRHDSDESDASDHHPDSDEPPGDRDGREVAVPDRRDRDESPPAA